MEGLIFLLLILLAFMLIAGIPFGISTLIYSFIKKRNYDKRLRLIALTPILITGYLIYTSIFPGEEFYRDDFKEVTGIELPENAKIEYKTASFPDHFGDYTSVSLIHVGKKFCETLPEILLRKELSENQDKIGSSELDRVLELTGSLTIEKEYSMQEGGGVYYYVGFLSDKESIIVKRLSW